MSEKDLPRVLFISHEITDKNGWGTCTYNWIKGLEPYISKNSVLITYHAASNDVKCGFKVYRLLHSLSDTSLKSLSILLDLILIRLYLKINDFDLVHVMVEPYIPLAHKISKKIGASLFISIHGTYSVRPKLTSHYDDYLNSYNNAKHIFSNSYYTASRLKEEFNVDSKVIPLGVNQSMFFPAKEVVKQSNFMFVGASKSRKGLLVALKGFSIFLNKHPEYEFLVIGDFERDSEYNNMVLKLIQDFDLPVRFLGRVSPSLLTQYYQQTIAHVLPSKSERFYFEGFGLVHLEANSCGSLTIGTKDSANEEVIEEGVSGFLVEQENACSVAMAMEKCVELVVNNPVKVKQDCINHARKYTWNQAVNVMRQYMNLPNAIQY